MYKCKILADSLAPNGKRLTTFEITYPKFVHNELMTHRMLSRNTASSRAIPIKTVIQQVLEDPVMPVWWGKAQPGMQANEELTEGNLVCAKDEWLFARQRAVYAVESLSQLGLHKQIANRILEPWMWITAIVSATEWANFFHLRCHPDAQPEIRKIAEMMQHEYQTNTPSELKLHEWHLPLVDRYELDQLHVDNCIKISVGRCARVSYLTHDGKRDPQADMDLCDRLQQAGHWSPFEHAACPALSAQDRHGNFIGWIQYRKMFAGENFAS